MRHRAAWLGLVLPALVAVAPASGAESGRYGLEIVVDGVSVPEHRLADRTYVEAIRGRHFSLRVSNPHPARVAVALAVDGRNVIDAKRTTAYAAAKWVLGPGEILEIPGWQVSGETARRFYFTETRSSYAKWLGDTRNVGTIEAVFFRERHPSPPRVTANQSPPAPEPRSEARDDAGRAGSIPDGAGPGTGEEQIAVSEEAPTLDSGAKRRAQPRESELYAATGAGERTAFQVQWVAFEEDPSPAAHVRLRYEFRPELVRLGVLLPREDLHARERGRGFQREYAPDPDR